MKNEKLVASGKYLGKMYCPDCGKQLINLLTPDESVNTRQFYCDDCDIEFEVSIGTRNADYIDPNTESVEFSYIKCFFTSGNFFVEASDRMGTIEYDYSVLNPKKAHMYLLEVDQSFYDKNLVSNKKYIPMHAWIPISFGRDYLGRINFNTTLFVKVDLRINSDNSVEFFPDDVDDEMLPIEMKDGYSMLRDKVINKSVNRDKLFRDNIIVYFPKIQENIYDAIAEFLDSQHMSNEEVFADLNNALEPSARLKCNDFETYRRVIKCKRDHNDIIVSYCQYTDRGDIFRETTAMITKSGNIKFTAKTCESSDPRDRGVREIGIDNLYLGTLMKIMQ